MKHALATITLMLLLSTAAPQASLRAEETVLELDSAQTQVHYTVGSTLHTVHGTFKLKHGLLHYDPATGKAGGELVVDATSGESGSDGRDRRMNERILESGKYPEITFAPDRVEGTPGTTSPAAVQVHGMFRIHGAEHEVTLPARAQVSQGRFTANIAFAVPYVKWGMKNPSTFILRVSDKVDIEIQAAGRVAAPVSARR